MARRPGRQSAAREKTRRLNEVLDHIIANPPHNAGFDPMAVSRAALDRLPSAKNLSKPQARKLRESFDKYVADLARFRERIDPVRDPDGILDPGNPDTVGRLVVIALLAQERVPLREMNPTYGSGVYAIYYNGQHPAYAEIRGSETPIYVGKADPAEPRAATPREQGVRLFRRLVDHREAIQEVEEYANKNGVEYPLRVDDFECRRLVCATNAQLVAERHLIEIFRPAWNQESKICFGISKHGDAATTRGNSKSPWDVLHPGRMWAMPSQPRKGMTPETVTAKLIEHFSKTRRYEDLDAILYLILDFFRQTGRASAAISEAAAESEEVGAETSEDPYQTVTSEEAHQMRNDPEFDFE
jgi:hypothetical protein